MNNGRITPALCCCVTVSLSLMFFQSMCRLFLLSSWFFCVCCSVENVPARNSDVDYRLLEAAKAGDLDTVKVDDTLKMTIWHCCLWGVMLQSQENAGDCSMTKVIVTVCNRVRWLLRRWRPGLWPFAVGCHLPNNFSTSELWKNGCGVSLPSVWD